MTSSYCLYLLYVQRRFLGADVGKEPPQTNKFAGLPSNAWPIFSQMAQFEAVDMALSSFPEERARYLLEKLDASAIVKLKV